MTIAVTRMTAAEFLDLPEDSNKNRYELVHGEVIVSPAPNLDHAFVVVRLLNLIGMHVQVHHLGELVSDIDTPFGPDDVRRPDLLFFSTARLGHLAGDYPDAPPDLCIEVLSPSNAGYDRTDKFDLYQKSGVTHYWIIDPMERTLEAYTLSNGVYVRTGHGTADDVLHLAPFPELDIPLGQIWRPNFKSNQ